MTDEPEPSEERLKNLRAVIQKSYETIPQIETENGKRKTENKPLTAHQLIR
jgi:hypothetical protein